MSELEIGAVFIMRFYVCQCYWQLIDRGILALYASVDHSMNGALCAGTRRVRVNGNDIALVDDLASALIDLGE